MRVAAVNVFYPSTTTTATTGNNCGRKKNSDLGNWSDISCCCGPPGPITVIWLRIASLYSHCKEDPVCGPCYSIGGRSNNQRLGRSEGIRWSRSIQRLRDNQEGWWLDWRPSQGKWTESRQNVLNVARRVARSRSLSLISPRKEPRNGGWGVCQSANRVGRCVSRVPRPGPPPLQPSPLSPLPWVFLSLFVPALRSYLLCQSVEWRIFLITTSAKHVV